MGAPTNAYQTYTQVGAREDLADIIYDVSPMDTFFFTKAARNKATSTTHEWQCDILAAPSATNAAVEGDDFSGLAASPTKRYKNYTTISRKDVVVSRTASKMNTAGRKEEFAYQLVKRGKEVKRDIETMALANNAATTGAAASARLCAGVDTWIFFTNHIKASTQLTSTTPAPVSGVAGTAATDGSVVALNEPDLQSALRQAWSCGGETDTILVGGTLKNRINTFTGLATRFRNVAAGQQADIVSAADVYVSDYGSHKIVLSRYVRATVVLCLDMTTWGLAWFDPIQQVQVGKTGDSDKAIILGEWTVEARSPEANTKITGVN